MSSENGLDLLTSYVDGRISKCYCIDLKRQVCLHWLLPRSMSWYVKIARYLNSNAHHARGKLSTVSVEQKTVNTEPRNICTSCWAASCENCLYVLWYSRLSSLCLS